MEEALYAAMAQKSSLRTALSGSYEAEFMVFMTAMSFQKMALQYEGA